MLFNDKMMSSGRRLSSLSLSGGHIVSDLSFNFKTPSYSPNAVSGPQHPFPWDESVDDINTPDIDPSFFDNDPFKKYNTQSSLMETLTAIDEISDEPSLFLTTADPSLSSEESAPPQLSQPALEDNFDLSALINAATTPDTESITVSPNDVLQNQYIPATTAPVLHYLQPRPVESVASTINYDDLTSTVDSLSTPSHSAQSFSPALSTHSTVTYLSPSPSPALSFTSNTSHSTSVAALDAYHSDATTDSLTDSKPEPEFLQPTVINDHLYTRPTKMASKRRRSAEKGSQRDKNNQASKKSRVSKRDKQKQMDEQIQHYLADNARCKREIDIMEKQIQWCKDYLFKKVVASGKP